MILDVERLDVAAGLVGDAAVVHAVVAVGAGAGGDAVECERAAENQVDIAAGIERIDVVQYVLEAVAGAQ